MADEVTHYEQIAQALRETYADLLAEDAKYITSQSASFESPEPTSWMRDAQAARQALAAPGLILGLAKRLFGEEDD